MAKKQQQQDTSSVETKSFTKGMLKDLNEGLMSEGSYLSARNAVNNSRDGNLGVLSNEQSNLFCTETPYTLIGAIQLYGQNWALFSTDDVNSEIGWFDELACEYRTVANDPCLNFTVKNLIIGESKENFECTYDVYWADGLNPDRKMNMTTPPWIQECVVVGDCIECTDTEDLNCDALRLARLTTHPCVKLEGGVSGGELLNGSYQATIAYTENEQRISDYSTPSNILSLFDHSNVNGSLEVIIEEIDQTYDEFELVIMGFVNQNLVARKMGIYSTHQSRISIDRIDPAANVAIPLEFIPLDKPSYERSEGIYRNGEYLLRVAPTTKLSFNYQPIANKITTNWVSVEYDKQYYRKAGTNVGYMRDEVYSFFVRWVYDTNDKTESYHIPGRAPSVLETTTVASPVYGDEFYFEANNTATSLFATGTTPDGGVVVAKGTMGYWQSSEIYPDQNFDVWEDLCGKNIRHHKMPDNEIDNHFNSTNGNIRVLGVQFSGIGHPLDNDGNLIPGIVGYEILRGTREGNKTIVAKGMLNNMGSYIREDNDERAYYPNYPYNDLNDDKFLSNQWLGSAGDVDNTPATSLGGILYARDKFTFHSPDTQFKHPFLSAKEVKIYETVYGIPSGQFVEPEGHPEHKIITDFAFILAALVGFGGAVVALRGEVKRNTEIPSSNSTGYTQAGVSTGSDLTAPINIVGVATAITTYLAAKEALETGGTDEFGIPIGLVGDSSPTGILTNSLNNSTKSLTGINAGSSYTWDAEGLSGLPRILRVVQGIPTFLTYWGETTEAFLNIIKAFSKFHQYALAYQSNCFHSQFNMDSAGSRVKINEASYIGDRLQEIGGEVVNNLYRGACVGLFTEQDLPNPTVEDTSRVTVSQVFGHTNTFESSSEFNTGPASAHYVGLKQRLRNQYGQVDGIIQVPTGSCTKKWEVDPANPSGATSDIIFGGDVYIGRYTEKNTFFYFTDWMYDLPNDFEYDYRLRKMMPYPTYWMDTKDFQINDFFAGIQDLFKEDSETAVLPSGLHNFDRGAYSEGGGLLSNTFSLNLIVKHAYMYLFNSGVRDFYVESEVNVEYRDWDDQEERRHYDPYLHTSRQDLFTTKHIKSGNFFKYDYSLSASRYYQGYPSWGTMQYRNYDPEVAETCYTYYPRRVIYSLPQHKDLRYDNWTQYLINNFKDYTSRVTAIKAIGLNGAMMLFDRESPSIIPGVDTLQTTAGTKITIGDGGLFSQPLQHLVNSDRSFEYGSCQNRQSVTNTPAGLFWMSQEQGKIFNYTDRMEEISQQGMKWWFEEFLPYALTIDFPNFELLDNSVSGIGCQTLYDNSNGIVYFMKKDYRVKPEFRGELNYLGGCDFSFGPYASVTLGDPRYFDSASWTVSYDTKMKAWISFHDWHPTYVIPSKNDFITVLNAGLWTHNTRYDSYCNFYDTDYPFEVDLVTPTGQNVNTLRSVEYLMEVYNWDLEGIDKHHVLDFNFDRAWVYNTEQNSGELRLTQTPKNNAPEIVRYPITNPDSLDILYSKEEHKYRFNQFWDATRDRGEFTLARREMWNTNPDGYTRELNLFNIDYAKPPTQRKKFRHYQSNLWLRRRVSGPNNMQLKLINSKNQYSFR